MKKWLKRIRGAFGIGLTWAAAWFGAGSILNVIAAIVFGGSLGIELMVVYALAGFVAGTAFSGVLGLADGRRSFHQMSLGLVNELAIQFTLPPEPCMFGVPPGIRFLGVVSADGLRGHFEGYEGSEFELPRGQSYWQ